MVEHINRITADTGQKITISIEIEKTKPELVNLIPLANVVSEHDPLHSAWWFKNYYSLFFK